MISKALEKKNNTISTQLFVSNKNYFSKAVGKKNVQLLGRLKNKWKMGSKSHKPVSNLTFPFTKMIIILLKNLNVKNLSSIIKKCLKLFQKQWMK